MRRVCACLLCLCCLMLWLPQAYGERAFVDRLLDTPWIDQTAKQYQTKAYRYNKEPFKNYGCGPASITNALLAACPLQDSESAGPLLLEVMNSLVYHRRAKDARIDLQFLRRWEVLAPEKYPLLSALLTQDGTFLHADGTPAGAEAVWDWIREYTVSGEKALWIGTMDSRRSLGDMLEILYRLHEAGRDDAVVTFGMLSTGTKGTYGPFRLGSGHCASLAFHIGTYFTEGSFYYLDSFPRNLPEESALNRKDKLENTYSLYVHPNEKLRKTHTVERINREVLCLRLNQDLLEQVQSSLAWQTMKPRLEYYFSKFQFYGNCMVIVSLPATAESGNS